MKLGKRLQQIEQMVNTNNYSHIWDCCCDHGFLGANLLNHDAQTTVHFVDIVPDLIDQLTAKLQRFDSSATARWQTHCLDVEALPLKQYEGKQLIIIAGVGGDLVQQFVSELYRQHPELNLEFLLCPVHHHFALRQTLIELNFSLIDEKLVEENRRFYEVIHVSTTSGYKPISPVGDTLWHSNSAANQDIAERYLAKTLAHYRRIQQGNSVDVTDIINAYQAISL